MGTDRTLEEGSSLLYLVLRFGLFSAVQFQYQQKRLDRRCRQRGFRQFALQGFDLDMKTPVHPGSIVREDCLKPLGLTVTETASHLGVGRQTISKLVNEKAPVSIEMAYRLAKAFGSTPETWLGMQLAFDLFQSRHLSEELKVERIARNHST